MNNDMASKLNNHINNVQNASGVNNSACQKNIVPQDKQECFDEAKINHSMELLGSLGKSQVFMTKPSEGVRRSTEEFMKNPEDISMKINFCDNLVSSGYPLLHAVNRTDQVFEVLKDRNTYLN